MNVQVIYCNHETTALDVRERLAFSPGEQLDQAYGRLRNSFPESELVGVVRSISRLRRSGVRAWRCGW